MRRHLLPALATTLVLVLGGCGGDDDPAAQPEAAVPSGDGASPAASLTVGPKADVVAYLNSFCVSLDSFDDARTGVDNAIGGALEEVGKSGDPQAVRAALVTEMDKAVALFRESDRKLAAAGYPDIADGEEIARKIRDALSFGDTAAGAREQIAALDTADLEKLRTEANRILAELGDTYEHSTDSIEFLADNKTMEQAFNKADKCT